MGRHVWLAFRLVVTVGVLAWLCRDAAIRQQLVSLPDPSQAGWLLAAWLAAGLVEVAGALRFWACLQIAGVPLTLTRATALHFSGLFTSLFLPGMAGGDALKGVLLARWFPQRRLHGLLAVLMERLSGFVVITLWVAVTAAQREDWFAQNPLAWRALHMALLTVGPASIGLICWFVISRTGYMRRHFRRFPFRDRILRIESGFDVIMAHRWRALAILAASWVGFAAYFLIFQLTATAYAIPLAWQDTFAVMPLVDLITMLPVTIAGLGLREQAFQWILAPLAGVTPAQSIVVSLVGFFVGASWALLGGLCFWRLQAPAEVAEKASAS